MSPEITKNHPNQAQDILNTPNSEKERYKRSHTIEVLMGINDDPESIKLLGEINYNLTGQKPLSYPQIRKHIENGITGFSSIVLSDDLYKNTCKTEILQMISFGNSDFLYVRSPNQKPKLGTREYNTLIISYTDTAESNINKIGEFLARQAVSTRQQ